MPIEETPAIIWHVPEWFDVIHFAFCPTEDKWNQERERVLNVTHKDITDYPSNGALTTWWEEEGYVRCLVTMSDWHDDKMDFIVSALSHEAVHVASRLLDAMKEDKPGEEVFAYMISRIAMTLYQDFVRFRKPTLLVGNLAS